MAGAVAGAVTSAVTGAVAGVMAGTVNVTGAVAGVGMDERRITGSAETNTLVERVVDVFEAAVTLAIIGAGVPVIEIPIIPAGVAVSIPCLVSFPHVFIAAKRQAGFFKFVEIMTLGGLKISCNSS